jgi:hypothetical protein
MERQVYPVPDGPSGPKGFFGYLVIGLVIAALIMYIKMKNENGKEE